MKINEHAISRREALKRTVVFSSGLLLADWFNSAQAKQAVAKYPDDGIHLLAMGDFGSANENQAAVADQMAGFAKRLKQPPTAVLALGDNFYRALQIERFDKHFESMYDKTALNCPFYAVLGNHDYGPKYDSGQGRPKADMQLAYAKKNPSSRWKMPSKWYSIELPNPENPLVKIIILDGNMVEGALTPQEKLAQKRWLEAELKKETKAPWRWLISHFPMYSECKSRGDSARVTELWGNVLKENPISLYLSGHDHTLQHLEVDGYHTSFVVSGAGGGHLYEVKPTQRGYAAKIFGFNHFYVTPEKFEVQYIDTKGTRLHAFRRTLDGKVKIIT